MLTLTVQDVAGWTSTEQLQVMNEPPVTGPTPTPWMMATATPWPNSTPSASPTPHPGNGISDKGNDDNDEGNSSSSSSGDGGDNTTSLGGSLTGAPGYPVGGTVVPAILPVTGGGQGGVWAVLVMGGIVTFLIGCTWFLSTANKEKSDKSA